MSTFLVSLGVVAATIATVLYVVLSGPDQPPTIRKQPSRAKSRRSRRSQGTGQAADPEENPGRGPPLRSAVAIQGAAALALPDSDVMRLRVLPAPNTTLWARVRSGVVLVVLVAVLGALLALSVGGLILGATLLIRSATA